MLLVLRALNLGDLLVAVPALHGLRRAYPQHRLLYAAQGWLEDAVALVGGFELLPTHGLDRPLALEPGAVDIAVNLHGRGPESQFRIEELLPNATISHSSERSEGPPWVDGIHERVRWTTLLQWHGIDADPQDLFLATPDAPAEHPGATIVHVGAGYGSRLWPADRFAEVSRRLRKDGHTVVFTGSASERGRAMDVADRAGQGPPRSLPEGNPCRNSRPWWPVHVWWSQLIRERPTWQPRTGAPLWFCSAPPRPRNGAHRPGRTLR